MNQHPTLRVRGTGDTRPRLVAIDWGTSSLRGVLIDAEGRIRERRSFAQGILQIPSGGFEAAWMQHFGDWLALSPDLCLLSGMVGSRQGWSEAAYCPCPADFSALCAQLLWLKTGSDVPCAIVPGMSFAPQMPVDPVAAVPDVMRGEEIQVIGAQRLLGRSDGLLVLPGTHSKWVRVKDDAITQFKTFMTGELYALLTQHSILGRTLETSAALNEQSFADGVRRGMQADALSHLLFGVRSLSLFNALDPAESASYLSGLLIGQELQSMQPERGSQVALIGSGALVRRYALALHLAGCECASFEDEATWAGHLAIHEHLLTRAGAHAS